MDTANGIVVAVKQLEGVEHGEKHFRIEVGTISGTHVPYEFSEIARLWL